MGRVRPDVHRKRQWAVTPMSLACPTFSWLAARVCVPGLSPLLSARSPVRSVFNGRDLVPQPFCWTTIASAQVPIELHYTSSVLPSILSLPNHTHAFVHFSPHLLTTFCVATGHSR